MEFRRIYFILFAVVFPKNFITYPENGVIEYLKWL